MPVSSFEVNKVLLKLSQESTQVLGVLNYSCFLDL